MLTNPSTGRMIQSVRRELLEVVAPVVADEKVLATIHMMSTVLHVAAQRADGEIGWMREEAQAIDELAAAVLAAHPEMTQLAETRGRYLDQQTTSAVLADAQADYDRASEVFSCLVEVAFSGSDQTLREQTEELVHQRVQREGAIVGDSLQLAR